MPSPTDYPVWFSPPVRVKTSTIGRFYEVNNVRTAAEQLLLWERRGPKWRKAVQTCMDAMEGKKSPEAARKAFEAAARESGMLVEWI
jgi:uncharacterized protein DUF982